MVKRTIWINAASLCAALCVGDAPARAGLLDFSLGFKPVEMTGSALYAARCGGCHALDRSKYGPTHRDLFGRTAGTQPGYRYSAALSRSGVVWTEDALDRWLEDPRRLVPGTKMDVKVSSPQERRLIIDFLKAQPR